MSMFRQLESAMGPDLEELMEFLFVTGQLESDGDSDDDSEAGDDD